MQSGVQASPSACLIGHHFNHPCDVLWWEVRGRRETWLRGQVRSGHLLYSSIGKKAYSLPRKSLGHVAKTVSRRSVREVVHLMSRAVLAVADSDTAVCGDLEFSWGVMGPNLCFISAAGRLEYALLDHLSGPVGVGGRDWGPTPNFSCVSSRLRREWHGGGKPHHRAA